MEEAVSDQRQFNQAFENSEIKLMVDVAARFRKGTSSDNFSGSHGTYCSQDVLSGLKYDGREVHKSAVAWKRQTSASNALEIWDQVQQQERKLADRIRKCPSDETGDLESLTKLVALIRSDIRKQFDVEALRTAENARQEQLLAKRLLNCDLDEDTKRLVFQFFVRLEDIYGLNGRKRVIRETAKLHRISESCVETVARNATYDHPEWVPEPL